MKSNSDSRFPIFEVIAPGVTRYHFNIEEVEVEDEPATKGKKAKTHTAYECEFVDLYGEPTYEKLVKAVLRSEKDECDEIALVNAYNAYMNELTEDQGAVDEYKAWLSHVIDVKAMVRADIEASK